MSKIVEKPAFGDPLSHPFWRAAEERRFLVRRCGACGSHHFYPRPFCPICRSDDVSWIPASGHGKVYSMTIVHRQASPAFTAPYVNALITLAEGPRILANLVGERCRIGDKVEVDWHERAGAPPLPVFRQSKETDGTS